MRTIKIVVVLRQFTGETGVLGTKKSLSPPPFQRRPMRVPREIATVAEELCPDEDGPRGLPARLGSPSKAAGHGGAH